MIAARGSREMKEAVILAAGRGSRLNGAADGVPKCLLTVGDRPLIEHNVRAMQAVGIERIHVVVGYGAEQVIQTLNGMCHYVFNDKYESTNSLYSLWLAREKVQGSFLLMNGDVLAHPEVLRRVASEQHSALAYDSGSGFDDEHMKVRVHNGYLPAIDKTLPTGDSCGEIVGGLRVTSRAGEALCEGGERGGGMGSIRWGRSRGRCRWVSGTSPTSGARLSSGARCSSDLGCHAPCLRR